MADAFKSLYLKNTELRGWLKYTDNANGWLNINYPVMYSGDNHKYLELDFYQTTNKNGALFFDERNRVNSADDTNRALIIYGHNMASGQMFAGLNQFLNNIEKAKSAPVIQLDTLYERRQYKVFAVMLINNREEDGPRFDYIRTDFADDADFMEQVANMRARSLYDYPVEVKEDDELLILSTCTAKSGAKFDDGRLAVVARRVREGGNRRCKYLRHCTQ